MPIDASVKRLPVEVRTSAPVLTQRLASGMSAVTTMQPRPARAADPVIGGVGAGADDDLLDQRIAGGSLSGYWRQPSPSDVSLRDPIDLVLDRASVGVDQDFDRHSFESVTATRRRNDRKALIRAACRRAASAGA